MKDDPFNGNWRFRAADSRLPMPAPLHWTQQIETTAEGISVVEKIAHASGGSSTIRVCARFDAKYYPVTGSALLGEIAYQRTDTRRICATGKNNGRVAMSETATVSEDRKTLTLQFSLHSPNGESSAAVAVFERIGD